MRSLIVRTWLFSVCLLVSLMPVVFLAPGCVTQKKMEAWESDSTAIFSTHPSRPFKYGYAYTKEECGHYFPHKVANYHLKPGDVVADVGGASGYISGALSTLIDSVTFYVQDIDTESLNRSQFDKMVAHYNSVRTTPQTNFFHFVIGNDTATKLPEGIFDKIVLRSSLHEMYFPMQIIHDLHSKLKRDGIVIVDEFFASPYSKRHHDGCGIRAITALQMIEFFEHEGYYLTGVSEPLYSTDNVLAFSEKQEVSKAFYKKKEVVDAYVARLETLYSSKVSKDEKNTQAIAKVLSKNMHNISTVYSTLETYIRTIGWDMLDVKKPKSALNIFLMNKELYPNSAEVYYDLGMGYLENKRYEEALNSFEQYASLEPDYNGEDIDVVLNKIRSKLGK